MQVLIVDDHPLMLEALSSVVAGVVPKVSLLTAENSQGANQHIRSQESLDLIVLDMHLGGESGELLLKEWLQTHPGLQVLIVSATDRPGDVERLLKAGAKGFVHKRAPREEIVGAITTVLRGEVYRPQSSPQPNGVLHARPLWGDEVVQGANVVIPPALERELLRGGVTPRQLEVLRGVMRGMPNKSIARELSVSVDTIKDHVAALLKTLNVSNRTQAVIEIGRRAAKLSP